MTTLAAVLAAFTSLAAPSGSSPLDPAELRLEAYEAYEDDEAEDVSGDDDHGAGADDADEEDLGGDEDAGPLAEEDPEDEDGADL
jgi:hypothetical protein